MFTFRAEDLLSFDFLHDNKGNLDFFKNNKIYNLNNLTQFEIKNYIFENKYYENIEEYVKTIMLTDFKHHNHETIDTYNNTNNKINLKYKTEYTLILDNM